MQLLKTQDTKVNQLSIFKKTNDNKNKPETSTIGLKTFTMDHNDKNTLQANQLT